MKSSTVVSTRTVLSVAVAALSGFLVTNAQAQMLEEVIVTAQKREQTLQEIPVSVSAFSGNFITEANIGDMRGLVDLTPGFNGRTEDSFIDALAIRGISTNDFGIGGDPSVAVFTDGVWSGRTGGVQMSFYDIERVEVVKGPQATLFGRNAIAGAISVNTNKPVDEFEGRLSATVAEFDHLEGHGMINVPLTDNLFFRGNVYALDNEGFLENRAGGRDLGFHETLSTRGSLRYLTDTVDAVFTAGYEDRKQDPSIYWDPELGLDKDEVNTDLGGSGYDESEITTLSANIDWEINDVFSLTSITGYKSYEFDYLEDYDARPLFINNYSQYNEVDYVSQELRLNFSNAAMDGFVGVAYYKEEIDARFEASYDEDALCNAVGRTDADDFSGEVVNGCDDPFWEEYWEEDIDPADILNSKAEQSFNKVDSEGWAIYADATFHVTDRLDVTIGARYTYDEKEMATRVDDSGGALYNNFNWEYSTDGFVTDKQDWDEFTPRAAINYTLSEEWSMYASVATGYKSGGYGTFGIDVPVIGEDEDGTPILDIDDDGVVSPDSIPSPFDPETSVSYEVGAKGVLFDNSLQLNLAYFFYTYEDLQLIYFDRGSQLVENLGEAENQGIEVDARWVMSENLELFFAGAWMDSEITDAQDMIETGVCEDCDGKDMPFAPEWSGAIHLTYTIPVADGDFFAKAEFAFQDDTYSDLDNYESITVKAWEEWNFRAGYRSQSNWGLTVWVENALDEEYFERGWANAGSDNTYGYGLTNTLVWPSKPRTIGATMYMDF